MCNNLKSTSLTAIPSNMLVVLFILLWNFSFAHVTIGGRDNIVQLINKQYSENITSSHKNFIIEIAANPVKLSSEQKNDLNKELLDLKVSTGINFYVLIPNPYAPTSDDSNEDIIIKLSSCTVNAVYKSQLNDPGALSVLLNIDCYLIRGNSKAVQFRPTLFSNSSKDQVSSVLLETFQKLKQSANFKDPKNAAKQYITEIIAALRNIYVNAPASEELSKIAEKAKNCDRSVDDFPFQFVLDGDLKKLTAEQRIDLIKCLDDEPSTGEDEKIILRILSNTPVGQRPELLNELIAEDVYNKRLLSAIDGDEFIQLINMLCGWLEPPDGTKWEKSLTSSHIIFFDEFDGIAFSFGENSKMEFKTRKNFNVKWSQELLVSPHEYVTVSFISDFFFAGHPFRAGDIITVPGLFVWSIFNEALNKQIKLTANVALNIPLFFVGVGEINALRNTAQISGAIRTLRYVNASASIIAASGGLVLAAGLEDELNLTKEGQDILKYWTWFNLAYAGVNLSYTAATAARNLWIACEKVEKANPSTVLATTIKDWKLSLKNIFSKHGRNIDELISDLLSLFKSRLVSRLNNAKGFSLKHTDDELRTIVSKGLMLKLPDDIIDDMLFISCRDVKPIKASDLINQMDNWVNVSKRGFPYKFTDIGEFNRFKIDLKTGLNEIGVATTDVRIQGSSLRTPDANDIDLAVIIPNADFDKFLINRFSNRIIKDNVKISLADKNSQELIAIANELNANPVIFNAQAKSFSKAMLERKISSYSSDDIIPGAKNLYKKIRDSYPNLNIENISIQTSGGSMDLKPFMNL